MSKPVWAIWIAFLGNSFGLQLIVQFMPTFMNKVLKVPITKTGIAAIIPPLTQIFVKVGAGWICDKITIISELRKIQLFNTLAMVGCGVFLFPLGFLPFFSNEKITQQIIALLCFTCSISFLGLITCGSLKSVTLVARDYSHFVMGIVQLVVCIGMLFVPIIVNWLVPYNTIEEWRSVFFFALILFIVTNFFFCKYCDSKPEQWAILKPIINEDIQDLFINKDKTTNCV